MSTHNRTTITNQPATLDELQARVAAILVTLPDYEKLSAMESLQSQGENLADLPDGLELVLLCWLEGYTTDWSVCRA